MSKQNSSTTTLAALQIERKNGKIWSPIRKVWLTETPEERVRQEYLCTLVNEYGYALDQIAEEKDVTGHRGAGQARADFIIWRTAQDKADSNSPLIIIECKSDNVTIKETDYYQGESYARQTDAPFFVTHNHAETKYWRVVRGKMPKTLEEIENIPHADDSDKQIEELLKKLKVFKEHEFADLLHKCHNVIRNREHLDPAAAFDEIAKILFLKVDTERRLKENHIRKNLFTAEFLDEQKNYHRDPVNNLFLQTKEDYEADRIFDKDETINLKYNTAREIVKLLERYNLSDTSEDIKGIAFERFLGNTFRGEIGQYFTPRSIVEFMVRMLEPQEGDIICDPASGSGGFLIRFFEIVRQQILADIDRQYKDYRAEVEGQRISEERKAELLRAKYEELQKSVDAKIENSRLWILANRCIYGTDANDRMARTSKMNMIMHGDGHGGVHYHNGFLNVNGIFEGRFNIVLTNPPFGSKVEGSDEILESDIAVPPKVYARYKEEYGEPYTEAQARLRAAATGVDKRIASLFTLPKGDTSKIKTEVLFIERCLSLLKPGGKLGIVLPEGIFNNPTLAYVREFCEDRAFVRAVVSLPQETFKSSGADVKTSLLFMQKFGDEEQADFDTKKEAAKKEVTARYQSELDRLETIINQAAFKAADFLEGNGKPNEQQKAEAARQAKEANEELKARKQKAGKELKALREVIRVEARALLRKRFSYPIFLYEAEKVGITATGEEDQNELYPNERVPAGIEKTCLELYREFRSTYESFLLKENAC